MQSNVLRDNAPKNQSVKDNVISSVRLGEWDDKCGQNDQMCDVKLRITISTFLLDPIEPPADQIFEPMCCPSSSGHDGL